jgi:hypothetical protein
MAPHNSARLTSARRGRQPCGNLFAYHYGITETVNGTWLEALCVFFDVNKEIGEAWIQALAEDFGATAPVNGSWIEALALEIQKNADLIDLLLARVNAEGGVFEAETCLEEQLNALEI